ncbi:MAG: TIR domain-containing protein [Rhodothermia bacterium]|nr:TIR domain-containing protein [Rhodothermia bacterium]
MLSKTNHHYRYWAFVSYSHRDNKWAEWLHHALEHFTIPAALRDNFVAKDGTVPKRLFPIFRDKDELPTSADLGERLNAALENAAYLVVICSPNSARSQWVDAEIRHFKKIGRADYILPIIVDGEPYASDVHSGFDPAQECFPPALRFQVDADGNLTDIPAEPIAADVRPGKDAKPDAILRLAAGILGTGYDTLKQRDAKRRQRRLVSALALTLAVLAVMIAQLFQVNAEKRHTDVARQEAVFQKNVALAAQKEAINEKNEAIRQKSRADSLLFVATDALAKIEEQNEELGQKNNELSDLVTALENEKEQTLVAKKNAEAQRDLAHQASNRAENERLRAEQEKQTAISAQAQLLFRRGLTAIKENAEPEAMTALAKAIQLKPDLYGAQFSLVQLLERQNSPFPIRSFRDSLSISGLLIPTPDRSGFVTGNISGFRKWDFDPNPQNGRYFPTNGLIVAACRPEGYDQMLTLLVDVAPNGMRRLKYQAWDMATMKPVKSSTVLSTTVLRLFQTESCSDLVLQTQPDTFFMLGKDLQTWRQATINGVLFSTYTMKAEKAAFLQRDSTLVYWEAATGKSVGESFRMKGQVRGIRVSQDGKWLASLHNNESQIYLRPFGAASITQRIPMGSVPLGIGFSEDGEMMYAYGSDSRLLIWDVKKENVVCMTDKIPPIINIRFYPTEKMFSMVVSKTGHQTYSTETCRPKGRSVHSEGLMLSSLMSPRMDKVATFSNDGKMQVWQNSNTLDHLTSIPILEKNVLNASLSPDGTILFTQNEAQRLQAWDMVSKAPIPLDFLPKQNVQQERLMRDGYILSTLMDSTATLWHVDNGKPLKINIPKHVPGTVLINKGYKLLSYLGLDALRVFHLDRAEDQPLIVVPRQNLLDYDSSVDNKWFVASSIDSTLSIWNTYRPADAPKTMKLKSPTARVYTDPNSKFALLGDTNGNNWVADLEKVTLLPINLKNRAMTLQMTFSPDGEKVAIYSGDATIRIFSLSTGQPQTDYIQLDSGLNGFIFSADGKAVLIRGGDNVIRYLDAESGLWLGKPLELQNLQAISFHEKLNKVVISIKGEGVFMMPISDIPAKIPIEVLRLSELVAGLEIDAVGQTRPITNRSEALEVLRNEFLMRPNDDPVKMKYHWFWQE